MADCVWPRANSTSTGDTLYGPRICDQAFSDWAWDAFDFDKEDWDDGWGFENFCDYERPLGRTYGAIWCLTYSAGARPNPLIDLKRPMTEWGWRYVQNSLDELDGRCTNGSYVAYTRWGGPFVDNWTQLYLMFFNESVVLRSGTLLHEARHAGGDKKHDVGNDDSSWEYNGAWRWHVVWLWWFWDRGQSTSVAMRDLARQKANAILSSRFQKSPGFTI
jgi:hypothetical protein